VKSTLLSPIACLVSLDPCPIASPARADVPENNNLG
jgi:hypothetical protein